MKDGTSPSREYEWGRIFVYHIRTIFDKPQGRCKLMVDIIKGRRKEICESPVIGIRLCSDEILYDRGGNTFEGSFDCISATVGCQESPDLVSPVTFPWAQGAGIPRLQTPEGSFWKPWSEGAKFFLIKTIVSSEELLFQMISLNLLDKIKRSGIMGHSVRALDNRH